MTVEEQAGAALRRRLAFLRSPNPAILAGMDWEDEGIVLAVRPLGEDAVVAQLLTWRHGRHAGLVRGGQGRRARALWQPGARLAVAWRARLAEQLGSFAAEPQGSPLGALLDAPGPLAALSSALAVTEQALPEREPHPACYEGLLALLGALPGPHWAETYVVWELQLLAELGFGLDLSGGSGEPLVWVSPRTGRAVTASAGAPWQDRLLPLPGFLAGRGEGGPAEVAQGLRLAGHFLEKHVFHPHDRTLPAARQRLAERFAARTEEPR